VCEAAHRKQLEVLRVLVSSRPDAGNPELRGSPLLTATMCGNIAAMEVLVQHGADVNGSKGHPWHSDEDCIPVWKRPLYVAIFHKKLAAVAWLLQQGITGERSGLGQALEQAARMADPTLMRMLLSYGPTQAVVPSFGPSALLVAVEFGHAAVAEELLKAGVPSTAQAIQSAPSLSGERDVRELLKEYVYDHQAYAQSPAILQAALQHGHMEFAQLLRDAMDWREAEH
jgi:ankyrin repeat protein